MTVVQLPSGNYVDFDTCVELMDSGIREHLHHTLDDTYGSSVSGGAQKFLDAYCALHEERFGEAFTVN